MAIGGIIILIYVLMWCNGTPIYDFNENFFYNLGINSILIIGVLLFCKDLKKTLEIRKKNKIEKSEISNILQNNNSSTWQEHLEKNYKSAGTKTNMNEIKIDNNKLKNAETSTIKNKKHRLKSIVVYSLLAISISINLLMFTSIIIVSNDINQIKDKYNKLENESSQMCEWHFQLTDDGPIKVCN